MEKCARWIRVSPGLDRREEHQLPDVDRWCESHGYEVTDAATGPRFQLHDVSAWHGEQEAAQEQAIADIQAGMYTVLVAWVGDRLERQGVELLLRFMRRVREAGGRVECSDDPLVNSFEQMRELGPSLAAWLAEQESRRKSDRIRIAINTAAREGSHWGRHPWGYKTEGPKFSRRLVPTAEGRLWIPKIFALAIEGWSAVRIAAWLDKEGVKPKGIANERNPRGKTGQWHPRSVAVIIHNPAYAGESADGREIPALVPWGVWQSAQAALGGRFRRGRTSASDPRWLTGEAAGCALCGVGGMNRKGSPPNFYLRCEMPARVDPARQPCTRPANMVPWELAVEMADAHLSALTDPVWELAVVEGNAELRAALLSEIEKRARQAARLPFDQMVPVIRELEAERNAIPGLTPGRREARAVLRPDGEQETYGSWWARMGAQERRDFLTCEIFLAFLNTEHEQAGRALERLGEPVAAEGKTAMWAWYADDPAEQGQDPE